VGALVASLAPAYVPRRPTETVLHQLVRQNLEPFLAYAGANYDGGLVTAWGLGIRLLRRIGYGFLHAPIEPAPDTYILDYSMFTGFRKRKSVREMVPAESQFKAAELRALPRVSAGLLDS
jgi:hypothetical protein